jgi:hypothetical protein
MCKPFIAQEEKIEQTGHAKGLDQLYEILAALIAGAEKQATHRCPYKNRLNECTAGFGCRNQRKLSGLESLPECAGDDKLDYQFPRKSKSCQ